MSRPASPRMLSVADLPSLLGSLIAEAKAPSSRSTPKKEHKLSLGTAFAMLFQGFLMMSDSSADIAEVFNERGFRCGSQPSWWRFARH
jgi:hypothetical protein